MVPPKALLMGVRACRSEKKWRGVSKSSILVTSESTFWEPSLAEIVHFAFAMKTRISQMLVWVGGDSKRLSVFSKSVPASFRARDSAKFRL